MQENQENHPAIFVGGPIQHAMDRDSFNTELRRLISAVITELGGRGVRVFSAHVAEEFGAADQSQFTPASVSLRDWAWMEECDVYVALWPTNAEGELIQSAGTAIELGWASAMGKSMVIALNDDTPDQYSHLVHGLTNLADVAYVSLAGAQTNLAATVASIVDQALVQLEARLTAKLATAAPGALCSESRTVANLG